MVLRNNEITTLENAVITVTESPITIAGSSLEVTASAEQLWETTMDPEKRILLRVAIDDDDESEIDMTFNVLMGDKVEPRREFIETNAKYVKNLDI